jgi:hypothetical protein
MTTSIWLRILVACGAVVCLRSSDCFAANPLQMTTASVYRVGDDRVAFRVEFAGKPDAARLRIMLNVDGPGHRESNTGADYMLEGLSFYRYPEGATGWNWERISPPLVIAKERTLTCVLPETLHVDAARWYVETTDTNWATADRFPKAGFAEFKFKNLPVLPASELAHDVASPSLQITDVVPLRIAGGGLAFKVSFAGKPDPARFRLMLMTDKSDAREPTTGADFMIEGVNFYSYPRGASNWTWNALAPPVIIAESNTLTYALLDAPPSATIQWVAETTNPDWSPAAQFPPLGKGEFKTDALPEWKIVSHHQPEDVSELTNGPNSLSCRFDRMLQTQQWVTAAAGTLSMPNWEITSMRTSLPVRVNLEDVVSGQTAAAEPARVFHSGTATRWEGMTLGVHWTMLAEPEQNGDVWLTGELHGDSNRCIRVGVGCELDPVHWTWHDDLRIQRTITPSPDPYDNCTASACGLRGEQSLYPFGAISSTQGVLIVETDPDEPRVFQIETETDKHFFGAYYDLALTHATAKFPGEATFRCALRSLPAGEGDAFRRALAAFYQRNPAFENRRVPTTGLWMPFFDISAIPHAEDFGFAFFEKEGPAGKDVAYCKTNGILTLAYTEPWLYWLPMPGKNRTETEAVRRMRFLAAAGNDQRSEFAAAALAGAVRKVDGSIRMDFLDVPWNSGARMEVSTDPELPVTADSPINRAMSEWRHITQVLEDDRFDGVYLDSMSAMDSVDYNPAAIAVADYPCTYEAGVFQPGLSTKIAAYEYTAGLGRAMERRGRYLMGNFPCWRFPFYMKYIDIGGEETTWLAAGRYQRLSDEQLIYRRVMSGRKPYGFLQAANFDQFKGPVVEQYFRDCLFWGFLPSFFSADGANNPYWTKPEWYERDRHFFKTYIPIIRRLAEAGWQPLGPEESGSTNLWIEQFGSPGSTIRHLTLRNVQDTAMTTKLRLGATTEPVVLVDPLEGGCDLVDRSGTASLTLAGGEIAVRDVVLVSRLGEEIKFMRTWNSGGGEADACLRTLTSLQAEMADGVRCILEIPHALVLDEDNPVTLLIVNQGTTSITVSDWKAARGAQLTLRNGEPKTITAGESVALSGMLRATTNGWAYIQWQLQRGGSNSICARVFEPRLIEPLTVVCPAEEIVAVGDETWLDVTLRNVTGRSRSVHVRQGGDFGSDERTETIGPESTRALRLPIKANGVKHGALSIAIESDGRTIFQRELAVKFLGDDASLARDSRVRIEVDSTYPGYTTKPLTDGVRDTTGIAWNEAAWASEETGGPHWVRIVFPEPKEVHALSVYWNIEGGVTYTSKSGSVVGISETGESVPLGEFANHQPVPVTQVEFAPRKLKAIELRQPPRGGSVARPNLMWLSEIEVH